MLLLYLLYVPQAPPSFDNINSGPIWRELQTMKLLIMQFSPFSCHFHPLRLKHLPEHPVLANPRSTFLPFSKTTSYVDCHIQSKAKFVSLDLFYRCTRNYELKLFGLQMAVCWGNRGYMGNSHVRVKTTSLHGCANNGTAWLILSVNAHIKDVPKEQELASLQYVTTKNNTWPSATIMCDKNALRSILGGKAEKLNRWMEDSSLWGDSHFVLYVNDH
jgi:hypothetical protein